MRIDEEQLKRIPVYSDDNLRSQIEDIAYYIPHGGFKSPIKECINWMIKLGCFNKQQLENMVIFK